MNRSFIYLVGTLDDGTVLIRNLDWIEHSVTGRYLGNWIFDSQLDGYNCPVISFQKFLLLVRDSERKNCIRCGGDHPYLYGFDEPYEKIREITLFHWSIARRLLIDR